MRPNLLLTYCGLLSITLISSCFLFFVVASENAKYVAATAAAAAASAAISDVGATATTDSGHQVAADVTAAPPPLNMDLEELDEVLPNYKKVKKQTDDAATPPDPTAATSAPRAAAASIDDDAAAAAAQLPEAAPLTRPPLCAGGEVDNGRDDAAVLPTEGNDSVVVGLGEELISKVPHVDGGEEQQQKKEEEQPFVIKGSVEAESQQSENAAAIAGVGEQQREPSLPDITEIPTVTVTELPLEILEPAHGGLDAYIIEPSQDSKHERENRTVDILENSNEEMQKDEQIIKINDSGGGDAAANVELSTETANTVAENIPSENATTTMEEEPLSAATLIPNKSEQQQQQNASATLNLTTAEEVPIPVFSEWTQKQMEAAEKQEAMEQEVVNTSAQKKNHTNGGSGKAPPLKTRAKNYASPDCGAKIIASNADASNTGAVLSSSKDEYMLSPCGNRIWFVVELCEAIQAQKIDLANFELFSSSPKNFTVAVSNRFPTRDWSNVGRFIAEDKRNVQSFELHPHLFGKFVRVDIHSHYSKEHFCPVSLFRVFGTSEFEAFETENHPNDDLMDDFDDELEQAAVAHAKNSEPNLFKSASDAVLSIVKKAAEVLAKPAAVGGQQNQTLAGASMQEHVCRTPAFGQFSCAECSRELVERINNALSCEFTQLNSLLSVPRLRADLLNTRVCAQKYGIATKAPPNGVCANSLQLLHTNAFELHVKQSYFLNLLPAEYVGALCQLLSTELHKTAAAHTNKSQLATAGGDDEHVGNAAAAAAAELALNLTIDKKTRNSEFKIVETNEKLHLNPEAHFSKTATEAAEVQRRDAESRAAATTEPNSAETEQLPRPPQAAAAASGAPDTTTATTTTTAPAPGDEKLPKEAAPDVNIFNVQPPAPPVVLEFEKPESIVETATSAETSSEATPVSEDQSAATTAAPATTSTEASPLPKSDEEAAAWDSLDNLLSSTVATVAAGVQGGTQIAGANGANLQQKIPSGPQSESVFIRLSNRIKALERNMSLSGQYLEELSRRYKKQVEELQQTLTQQTQTVHTLEEQSRRHNELELLYAQRNAQLKDELDDLTLQVHACIVVIIFVGAFVFLVLMVGILFYRSMRRETKELLTLHADGSSSSSKRRATASAAAAAALTTSVQRKLNRRKSFEDFSDHQHSLAGVGGGVVVGGVAKNGSHKQRRPSEEAMLILKDCGGDAALTSLSTADSAKVNSSVSQEASTRQRKISVCYGSNNHLNGSNNSGVRSQQQQQQQQPKSSNSRRKGEKHSWPWQHMGQLPAAQGAVEDYDKFLDADTPSRQRLCVSNGGDGSAGSIPQLDNKNAANSSGKAKSKKSGATQVKRQDSEPAAYVHDTSQPAPRLNITAPSQLSNTGSSDYDENLLLDEDDLDNFIPNTDLAYNEFMPDGPSAYHIVSGAGAKKGDAEKTSAKKSRRLSSPGFFKSPFSKSLKSSSKSSSGKEESTSWEWYRSKKTEAQHHQQQLQLQQQQQQKHHQLHTSVSVGGGGFLRASPAASLDSSSLSEINFPTNSTENSFRILEEAILSSGEMGVGVGAGGGGTGTNDTTITASTNGNGHNGGGGSSGSRSSVSNRSSTSNSTSSSAAKKKNRSFNKIFRKVF